MDLRAKRANSDLLRKTFPVDDINSLPEVPANFVEAALAEPQPFIPLHVRCELCKDVISRAAVCCADCKRRLCHDHAEDHVLHTTNHELIEIEDELAPERYEVQRCKTHENHVLNEICKLCMKLFCKRCDTKGHCSDHKAAPGSLTGTVNERTTETTDAVAPVVVCPSSDCGETIKRNKKGQFPKYCSECNGDLSSLLTDTADGTPNLPAAFNNGRHITHEIVPLRDVTDELREKMRSLSQEIYDKIGRCRNLEKKTWKSLSDIEEDIDKQTKEVDNIVKDMIEKITQQGENVKTELHGYLTKLSTEVDEYSEASLIGITQLDDVYMYGQNLADRCPDGKLLEEFEQAKSKLRQSAADMKLERELPLKKPHLSAGIPSVDLCTEMVLVPTGIDYISKHETSKFCYGVSWTDDGRQALCSITSGLELLDNDMKLIRQIKFPDYTGSLSAHLLDDKLYTHLYNIKDKYSTFIGSLDQPTLTAVDETKLNGQDTLIHHISAKRDYLAIIDKVKTQLKICTAEGEHLYDIQLKDMQKPYGVELLPADNSVLVSDYGGNQLRKYRLQPDAELLWTCQGLISPAGITTDDSGLIFVTNLTAATMYLISPDGKKLKELTHPKLQEAIDNQGHLDDVSIARDKIVVACREQGVLLFRVI